MAAKKVFVGNYKGGVGKTTSIYQIALHMIEAGKKVLLIDLDPQCSLSEICLSRSGKRLEQLKPNECLNYVYDMWLQYKKYSSLPFFVNKEDLVKKTDEDVYFIPSNILYENGGLDDLALKLDDNFEDLFPLQQFFHTTQIENEYGFDYILFDCPPSNNVITKGAFLLSNYYIIPTIIQTLSVRGVIHYINKVNDIYKTTCENKTYKSITKSLFGERPKLLGIFETLKKGKVKNQTVMDELISELKTKYVETVSPKTLKNSYIFKTIINNYEDIARATADGEKCSEYRDLTEEILLCIKCDTDER